MRIYHLVRELARYHEVHLILKQPIASLENSADGREFPKGVRAYSCADDPPPRSWLDRLPRGLASRIKFRLVTRSLRGVANSTILPFRHLIAKVAREVAVDVVVFEHISTLAGEPYVARLLPRALRVLDAHNVEHMLQQREFAIKAKNGQPVLPDEVKRRERALQMECSLGRYIDSFWACSEEDKRILERCSRVRGHAIANGVDTDFMAFDRRRIKSTSSEIVFCGALTTPANIDGLRFFCREIWPRIRASRRDLRFAIVGCGLTAGLESELRGAPGVVPVGEVDDIRPWMRRASVAVVPLRAGSGTRGKIVEAMSLGNPVVSTNIGAEGIEAVRGRHILVADEPSLFAEAVLGLLADDDLFHRVRHSARHLVERRYEWRLVGKMANEALNEALSERLQRHRRGRADA